MSNVGAPAEFAVAFTHTLRRAGLDVSTRCTHAYSEALCATGLSSRSGVYWAGRATLIHRPEDIDAYDDAFAEFFERRPRTVEAAAPSVQLDLVSDGGDDGSEDGNDAAEADETVALRWSQVETLRHRDFAEYDADELRSAQRLMATMRWSADRHRSPRRESARRASDLPDVRRTVRRALRSGGEPIERHFRRRTTRARRLVLLLDISGSMETYARALLRFIHAAVAGRQRVEAFAIGTRLTRITRELGGRDPDAALSAAADRVLDWNGGTRLGPCLRRFNDEWGVRGMARNASVVILSDGWDRGDPTLLAEEMERLHRVTHRLVWVNPLKTTPGYAPLARGMAAALPHVDEFVEGHSIAALEQLAALVAGEGSRNGRTRQPTAMKDVRT